MHSLVYSQSLEQVAGSLASEASKCQVADSDPLGLFPHIYLSESRDTSQSCPVA